MYFIVGIVFFFLCVVERIEKDEEIVFNFYYFGKCLIIKIFEGVWIVIFGGLFDLNIIVGLFKEQILLFYIEGDVKSF